MIRKPSDLRAEAGGFTLIELMIVITIMGLIVGWAVIDYKGITEEQKLHSTIREVIGLYRETRAFAAKEHRLCFVDFDIENNAFRKVIYPITDTMGNFIDSEGNVIPPDEVEDRAEASRWFEVPNGVVIQNIQAPGPNGNEEYELDYWIQFRSDGTIPPHIVHFASRKGLQMSLGVEEMTGSVLLREGYTEFYSPKESEFENLGGGSSLGR